ncbi:DUF1611 domain-containing protein [Paenibacillaceae bacterium]|nr:DUF1611 domain-containing protein [Paenibacillaceae bacterium]
MITEKISKPFKADIVIIDTGVDIKHELFGDKAFFGVNIYNRDDKIYVGTNIQDEIGHGTAITHKIITICPWASVFIIKIFQQDREVDENILLRALEFIKENIECNVINISAGLTICTRLHDLQQICKELHNDNIILISAFHSDGSLSYPASFKEVIGVEMGMDYKNDDEFDYVESDFVNIIGRSGRQKLANISSSFQYVEGSSFSTAVISGLVLNYLHERNSYTFNEIMTYLKIHAIKVYEKSQSVVDNSFGFELRKAIAFPFNKEMSNMIKFHDLLSFNVTKVLHVKYSGQVGKLVSEIIGTKVDKDFVIENIDSLDWEAQFDTVILGHTVELSKKMKKDINQEILKKCIKYGKNLYAFDPLLNYDVLIQEARSNNCNVFFPTVDKNQLPAHRFGKLCELSTPVLGIFGTSSMQGKFTLQLVLRSVFKANGYEVGQLGTEPSSLLFGFDEMYPMGYNSNLSVSRHEALQVINDKLMRIERKQVDIILVGSQSSTIPELTTNTAFYTFKQIEFLMATNPDIAILCVNVDDDYHNVLKTINAIQSLSRANVLSLVIYPVIKKITTNNLYQLTKPSKHQLDEYRIGLQEMASLPVFILGINDEMERLYEQIIHTLS